nr:hypothetical protein CFP56_71660 [Quercus suber]
MTSQGENGEDRPIVRGEPETETRITCSSRHQNLGSGLGLHRDLEFRRIDQNDRVEIGVSDLDLSARCREFGSGLKKETSVIREVASRAVMDFPASLNAGASIPQELLELVGQAIDDIGSSVWKSAAEIVTHGADNLFVAVAAGSDSDSDSNNGR